MVLPNIIEPQLLTLLFNLSSFIVDSAVHLRGVNAKLHAAQDPIKKPQIGVAVVTVFQ
jgi:hypothetical protein